MCTFNTRPKFPSFLIFVIVLGGLHWIVSLTSTAEDMPKTYCTGCHKEVPATLYHSVWCHTKRLLGSTFTFTDYLLRSKNGEDVQEELDKYTEEFCEDYNIDLDK